MGPPIRCPKYFSLLKGELCFASSQQLSKCNVLNRPTLILSRNDDARHCASKHLVGFR